MLGAMQQLAESCEPADFWSGFSADAANDVWRRTYRSNRSFLNIYRDRIAPIYLAGIEKLGLGPDQFPSLSALNGHLAPAGWNVAWVRGFIPGREFADYILKR